MLSFKKTLLETGYFEDNQYLYEYIELILENVNTKKIKGITQEHHLIPVFCYSTLDPTIRVGRFYNSNDNKRRRELLKAADVDPNNKKVHLKFSDHVKAHVLLAKCGKSYNFIIQNANACMLMLNLVRKAIDHSIVSDLETSENIQTAYEYVMSIKRKPTEDNPEYREKVMSNLRRGGSDKKVRCIETSVVYNSLKEAEDANGLSRHRLNQILTGRRKQIPGMTFEYVEDTTND